MIHAAHSKKDGTNPSTQPSNEERYIQLHDTAGIIPVPGIALVTEAAATRASLLHVVVPVSIVFVMVVVLSMKLVPGHGGVGVVLGVSVVMMTLAPGHGVGGVGVGYDGRCCRGDEREKDSSVLHFNVG
jgi:hypothetical protein